MDSGTPQPSNDNHAIPYSHSIYCFSHPTDGFIKVGVAHIASAEIRHLVMAGCQVSHLLFMSRTNAYELQSAILRTVATMFRDIDAHHPILGEGGLNGHGTSWRAHGGTYDLEALAWKLGIPHANGLADLPYEVVRTTLGLPRLRWQDWRIGTASSDYREPLIPARHISRGANLTLPTYNEGKGPTPPGVGPFRLSSAVYLQDRSTRRFEATPNPGFPKRLTPAFNVTVTPLA